MPNSPLFDDADLGDDPELLAAISAAFGDESAESLTEELTANSPTTDVTKDQNTAPASPLPAQVPTQEPTDNLADLIGKLDQAMASMGDDQDETSVAPTSSESSSTSLQENRYVVFQTGEQLAAIPLSGITEIDRVPSYTPLPRTPQWCLGVANLRGQIVSITDLAALIGEAGNASLRGQKIMIIRSEKFAASTALVVDRVGGIRSFNEGTVKRPDDVKSPLAQFASEIASIDREQVLLVDPDLLMQHSDMQPYMQA